MLKQTQKSTLKEYWQHKIGINYDVEFECYKKVCGLPYKHKLLGKHDLYNNLEIITYDGWSEHISDHVKKLKGKEIREYSRFLNQECRNYENKYGSLQSVLTPVIILLLGFLFTVYSNNILQDKILSVMGLILSIIVLICMILFLIFIYGKLLVKQKKCKNYQYFYHDIKEIVDEYINKC